MKKVQIRCRDCGKRAKRSRCSACLEKIRDDYRARVKRGQCVCCKLASTAGAFCFDHWIKNIGSVYRLNWKNGGLGMLKELWEAQGGQCALTGQQLIPGHNASIDHIVPVSKGGSTTRSNLRWVLQDINKFKSALSDPQLIELCHAVIRHHEKNRVAEATNQALSERSN